jgi:hypothetical protein
LEIPKSFLIELQRDAHGSSFTFHPRSGYARPFDREEIMRAVKRAAAIALRGERLGLTPNPIPKVVVGTRPPQLPEFRVVGWSGKADRDNLKFF